MRIVIDLWPSSSTTERKADCTARLCDLRRHLDGDSLLRSPGGPLAPIHFFRFSAAAPGRIHPFMPLAPGTALGPYQIVALVGAGGMGEVYRARDPRLERDVAIKVLPEPMIADPMRLHRFVQEARAVAALSHPHILAIFDAAGQEMSCSVVDPDIDVREKPRS